MRWDTLIFNKWSGYGLLLLCVFIIQSTLIDIISIMWIKPNLLVCFIVCIAFFEGEQTGGIFGAFTGVLCDLLVGPVPGYYTIVFTLTGSLIGYLSAYYFRVTMANAVVVCGAVLPIISVITFTVHYYIKGGALFWRAMGMIVVPETIYSLLFVPLCYILVGLLHKYIGSVS